MDLTAKNLTTAKPGDTLRDATIPGLHCRVSKSGKAFYLWFRTKTGIERRPKIGNFPLMTVQQARDIARDMLLQVVSGRDPMQDRAEERAAATMSKLCEQYLKDYAERKKSAAEDARMTGIILKSKLGRMRVKDVEYDHVREFHAGRAATPYQANRMLALLSKMFNLAEQWKMRPQNTNPCRHVHRYRETARRRKMSANEAAAIAAALEAHRATAPATVAFIYLLILSGARKSEIAAIRPEWIDGNVLSLPDSKTGQRTIYLPPQAVAIIEKLPKVQGQTLLGIKDPTNLWKTVRKEAGCPDLRLHDLRRTFASAALSMGLSLAQVGELLGHASTQTTKGYAYLMQEPALLAAETVASKLESMMNPTRAPA